MKKWIVLILALLVLAVPVLANVPLVQDGEGLLSYEEAARLEEIYAGFAANQDFTPILVTVDSFGGRSAGDFAGRVYDQMGYPEDGILYLVSLSQGEWYILTNGACYARISNRAIDRIGEELVEYLRDGDYYEAFALFPQLAEEAFYDSEPGQQSGADEARNYTTRIVISMLVGLAIGGICAGIMAAQMKTVKAQKGASDYIRSGSMHLHQQRDIFLYSHVSRTAKPKSDSSGGDGGSRGGSGGRI